MSAYLPACIWILSNFACHLIARRRQVQPTAIKAMSVAVFGPFAIPFVLAAKPTTFKRN
jgi:hypothetical protein